MLLVIDVSWCWLLHEHWGWLGLFYSWLIKVAIDCLLNPWWCMFVLSHFDVEEHVLLCWVSIGYELISMSYCCDDEQLPCCYNLPCPDLFSWLIVALLLIDAWMTMMYTLLLCVGLWLLVCCMFVILHLLFITLFGCWLNLFEVWIHEPCC